jgi:hypothetical protein
VYNDLFIRGQRDTRRSSSHSATVRHSFFGTRPPALVMCVSHPGLRPPGFAAAPGVGDGGHGDSPPPTRRAVMTRASHGPGSHAGGLFRVGNDPARVPAVNSESAVTSTRKTRRRESEEECERRSPSQNQNVPDQPVPPLNQALPPTTTIAGRERHLLGQGRAPAASKA